MTQNSSSKQYSGPDQRYLPRWEMESSVLFQLVDNPTGGEGVMKDLNCSGASVCSDKSFAPNQKISLKIKLSEHQIINVTGRIVWIRPSVQQNTMGIHFYNVTEEAQEMILQHAFELKRHELVQHWWRRSVVLRHDWWRMGWPCTW